MIEYRIKQQGKTYRLERKINGKTKIVPTTGSYQDCHASLPFFARWSNREHCYLM